MTDNIHEGHREREREAFLLNGFSESTPPHKVLELLLFYCVSRIDTNPLAHQLIDKYKTVGAVLEAPVYELAKFKGLSERGATLLKMIIPIARYTENEKLFNVMNCSIFDHLGDFFVAKYYGMEKERFSMLCLNSMGKVLNFSFLSEGDISMVNVSVRDILKTALDCKATCVVIAHNHPASVALPSDHDGEFTKNIYETLKRVNIRLIDHIIVAQDDFISMAQSEKYEHIFKQ